MIKYIWNIKSTDLGYAIECSHCKHKIDVKDAVIAEKKYDICPFCKHEMDLSNLDYDKLLELAYGGSEIL